MAMTAAGRWLLLDKSALVRAKEILEENHGELCTCAITRLELLYSARSAADYRQIEENLDTFHDLRIDAETVEIATSAQRELAQRGRHRIPIPDLLIASCAQQHQAAVLHLDRHYDALTEVLAFQSVRLSPCSR
jgi:predicted nucleic acid-binding protein